MNRNTNAHFAELPNVEISRSTFDRSHSHKSSGLVGRVIPIFYDDVLPGDTVVMDTSKVVRFQTLLTPMMDNMYADVYWFFVPNRLVWDHWINLMGENTASPWAPSVQYEVPVIKVPAPAGAGDTPNNNKSGTILDYLGFPVGMAYPEGTDFIEINALPIRGYCKIMQDWFRDENLSDPINIYTGDSAVIATTEASYINDLPHGGVPFVAAKFADYFTSCLPAPQKGDPVSFSVNVPAQFLPVKTRQEEVFGLKTKSQLITAGEEIWPMTYRTDDLMTRLVARPGQSNLGIMSAYPSEASGSNTWVSFGNSGAIESEEAFADFVDSSNPQSYYKNVTPNNLWATLTGVAGSFSINDLRYAFQMQKLLERDARGGTRYIETLKAHFNVTSPDQRLQRSEYLGGNRFGITVNQVSNQAQSETDFLGDLGAYSVTTDVHSDFTKSFTEHGMLFGLLVVRYDHSYSQALEKFWNRRSRFDYYWPVFANIGEQPVRKSEIFGTAGDDTFGYNEAWADYRFKHNRVSGELRPYVNNGLASWTLSDDYDSAPSLSDSWIREDKSNVDRVLAVTSEVSNQFWFDIYFNTKWTRPMPVYSVPGLIDHH